MISPASKLLLHKILWASNCKVLCCNWRANRTSDAKKSNPIHTKPEQFQRKHKKQRLKKNTHKMKTTIVIYACLVLLGLIAASIQTETITSTSPLFMWTVNGQVRDDNVYRHFKNCNHEGQVPFLSIAGPKIVIVQNNVCLLFYLLCATATARSIFCRKNES